MNAETEHPAWDELLAAFPAAAGPRLRALVTSGGVMPAVDAVALAALVQTDVAGLMVRLLPLAAAFAVVPISGFRVGAVAQAWPGPGEAAGALYLGANLEFAGQALGFGVHAEQSAVNNAWLHGETRLASMAISAAPCGFCRQFLWELSHAASLDLLLPARRKKHTTARLSAFLPQPFGPGDLQVQGGLMDPATQPHSLSLASGTGDPLVQLALEAARHCYAPYTHGYAGAAVQSEDGASYAGRYAENAAYNPSLSPMASALSLLSMHRPGGLPTVRRAVLVDVGGAQRLASSALVDVPAGVEYHRAVGR